jgi:hypothetical protein
VNFRFVPYHTDLFHALVDKNNEGLRDHPIFSAMLYLYCPMAAEWWLEGVIPDVPYDPVWEAARDFASGITLKESLEKKGLRDLVDHVKKYVEEIDAYRNHSTTNYLGSELSPTFGGGKIEVTARAGCQAAFVKHFGGDWRNVLRYSRAWAFTIHDWRAFADIQPGKDEFQFTQISIPFGVPWLKQPPLEWPAWAWNVENGYAFRIVLGMMVNNDKQDQFRFALAARSVGQFISKKEDGQEKRDIQPWKAAPHIYSLERQFGYARAYRVLSDTEEIMTSLRHVAGAAKASAHPAAGFLLDEPKCLSCGFRGVCFVNNDTASPVISKTLSDDFERLCRVIA